MDEVLDGLSGIHATCRFTEVGAAAEGAVLVDGASAIAPDERTAPGLRIGRIRERFTPSGAGAFSRDESFARSKHRRFSGEAELAASRASPARAGEIDSLNFRVDGLNGLDRYCLIHLKYGGHY